MIPTIIRVRPVLPIAVLAPRLLVRIPAADGPNLGQRYPDVKPLVGVSSIRDLRSLLGTDGAVALSSNPRLRIEGPEPEGCPFVLDIVRRERLIYSGYVVQNDPG